MGCDPMQSEYNLMQCNAMPWNAKSKMTKKSAKHAKKFNDYWISKTLKDYWTKKISLTTEQKISMTTEHENGGKKNLSQP